jgi:hypothetical protein
LGKNPHDSTAPPRLAFPHDSNTTKGERHGLAVVVVLIYAR